MKTIGKCSSSLIVKINIWLDLMNLTSLQVKTIWPIVFFINLQVFAKSGFQQDTDAPECYMSSKSFEIENYQINGL